MTTAVRYCSDALLLLGEGTIASFEEGTDKASVCGALYPAVRDAMLTSYPWRFTLSKARLSRLADAPLNEWRYAYQPPADLLILRALFDTSALSARPLLSYELFDGAILCDAETVFADYQRRVPEDRFPPHFVQLLRYALAAEFAMAITDQATAVQIWTQKAFGTPSEGGRGGYFRHARGLDAQQQPGQVIEDFSLINARFGDTADRFRQGG